MPLIHAQARCRPRSITSIGHEDRKNTYASITPKRVGLLDLPTEAIRIISSATLPYTRIRLAEALRSDSKLIEKELESAILVVKDATSLQSLKDVEEALTAVETSLQSLKGEQLTAICSRIPWLPKDDQAKAIAKVISALDSQKLSRSQLLDDLIKDASGGLQAVSARESTALLPDGEAMADVQRGAYVPDIALKHAITSPQGMLALETAAALGPGNDLLQAGHEPDDVIRILGISVEQAGYLRFVAARNAIQQGKKKLDQIMEDYPVDAPEYIEELTLLSQLVSQYKDPPAM